MEKIVQTAGRDALGEFAPAFARYNDDILFGEDWNDPCIDHKLRCIITLVALVSAGVTDSSLQYHLKNAKRAGVTREEIAGVITHTAFYAGWPKAWAAFSLAKEVWTSPEEATDPMAAHAAQMCFPIGQPNDGYAQYFSGQSYLAPISTGQIPIFNVTFAPGCRNNWHIHRAAQGGGQILLCVAGQGYYQEWGKSAQKLLPGDCVNIPAGVKHWHGAGPEGWFSHLAIEVPGQDTGTLWQEPVSLQDYETATKAPARGQ